MVKNRRHGVHNPNAMFRKEVTAEEVLASRLVCEPLHLWMLCSPNEGAAAIVLQRDDGARPRRAARRGPAPFASAGQRARRGDAALGDRRHRHHSPVDARRRATPTTKRASGRTTSTSSSARTPTPRRELLAYAELDLCAPGEQARLLADGDVALGGARPVNPSGGLLSKGEPLGASALGQVVELVHQLRGDAGERQVDGARVGLAHTVGRGANACCVIVTV